MSLGRGIGSTARRLLRAATATAVAGVVLLGAAGTGAADPINSGGRAADITLDGWPDLVARNKSSGRLMVYPHSGRFSGTDTFPSAFTAGWGWDGMDWIGTADVNGDQRKDIVARTKSGELYAYLHSGATRGSSIYTTKILIGTHWNINDLLTFVDIDGDGREDVFARRAGTGDLYAYRNTGSLDTGMFANPGKPITQNWQGLRWFQFSDLNRDGHLDMIAHDGYTMFVTPGEPRTGEQRTGEQRTAPKPKLGKIPNAGQTARSAAAAEATQPVVTGWGWDIADTVLIADVNKDGYEDLIARMKDGKLYVYPHSGSLNGTATFSPRVLVGWGWEINDIIT
ncbi:FG-GAP repeat domain-containing protein [Streptoalloteichus hindustanus]|uniref:Repeat domain-containing protein n=1 Tax=Streptoalloteichus hindustanus TaxID=2017 RepID=A0A1M5JYR2_STRHI|nr:VCBS repeat-containing protein [Streptoalloteichus hindustanus]SHG45389.1 Repeat domain-containing protein [Streptoalloteichus hindustanus]